MRQNIETFLTTTWKLQYSQRNTSSIPEHWTNQPSVSNANNSSRTPCGAAAQLSDRTCNSTGIFFTERELLPPANCVSTQGAELPEVLPVATDLQRVPRGSPVHQKAAGHSHLRSKTTFLRCWQSTRASPRQEGGQDPLLNARNLLVTQPTQRSSDRRRDTPWGDEHTPPRPRGYLSYRPGAAEVPRGLQKKMALGAAAYFLRHCSFDPPWTVS